MTGAGWSTAELARLAGVSARTVRYYHEVGVLPEPDRRANGYKSYGPTHLTRLLRVRRLIELGFTLDQVRALDSDETDANRMFRSLQVDISARIEQLELIRQSLPGALSGEIGARLPPGFDPENLNARITKLDEATLAVLNRMLPEEQRAGLREWLPTSVDSAADDEFEALPEDAEEDRRTDLAKRMLPAARAASRRRATTRESRSASPRDIGIALSGIYNRAQMDVLTRVAKLLDNDNDGSEPDK